MTKEVILLVGDFVYIKINDEFKYKQIKMIHKINDRYELEFEKTLKRYELTNDLIIGLNPKVKNRWLIDELKKLNLDINDKLHDLYIIGKLNKISFYPKTKTKMTYDTVGVHINVNNYIYKYE